MQTEASLERDTDLIQDYIEILKERTARPSPFGKLAALTKLGALRRRLAGNVRRAPDPEIERAEAAATAETTGTWGRRFATSFWGARLLMALALVAGHQLVLLALLVVSAAYTNATTFAPLVENGYLPRSTRAAIVLLVLFVFAFYAVLPLLSMLLLWGGRLLRSWRLAIPAVTLLLLAAAVTTFFTFRGLENPAFKPDSIHQFVETRFFVNADVNPDVNPYKAYLEWLNDPSHWLLKDPKLKVDYDEYLRNGPGRWLTNSFDTTDPKAWADAKSLEAIGKLVDSEYDQAKFRDWLRDYVERNKINSRDIDNDIEKLVAPANQRFFSVWQAEPFLGDRDVNVRRYYFGEVYRRMRLAGMIFFGSLVFLYLVIYLVGPTAITAGWIARSLKLSGAAGAIGRFRERYYATPELNDLKQEPYYEGTLELFARVHRSYVRSVLAVSVLVFAVVALWLAGRATPARPMATQNALMHRFVALPAGTPPAAPASAPGPVAAVASPLPGDASAAFPGGTGDPALAVDADGDGRPDERAVPPLEARVAALEKQIDDSDYEIRKRFKTTATLLEAYRREIDALKAQNAQLEQRQGDLFNTTNALGGRLGAAEGRASAAEGLARQAESRAESVGVQVSSLADTVEERTTALDRRAGALEKRDDELESTVDAVAMDLDEKTQELRARTERLGERATDLAERAEQIADLQRTVYASLVDEFGRQIDALERRSQSRLYRFFNKSEARAQLADLRRRIQLVRARLRENGEPEALEIDKRLADLQERIGPVEDRYR